jgi:hypothetical protein
MLELGLDYDAMAKLLDMERANIVELCLIEANVPNDKRQRVAELYGMRQVIFASRPPIEEVHALMWHVHRHGSILLNDACKKFHLTRHQIKVVDEVEHWVHVGRYEVKGFYGPQVLVNLTAHGCKELGIVQEVEPMGDPLTGTFFDEDTKSLAEVIVEGKARKMREVDNLDACYSLLMNGSDPSLIAGMVRHLLNIIPSEEEEREEPKQIEHE